MKQPKRWLTTPGALSERERRALRAGREVRAPDGAKQAVRAALSAALPPGALLPTSGASGNPEPLPLDALEPSAALAGAAGSSLILKSMGVGALAGAVLMGGASAVGLRSNAPAAPPTMATGSTRVATAPQRPFAAPMPAARASLPPASAPVVGPELTFEQRPVARRPAPRQVGAQPASGAGLPVTQPPGVDVGLATPSAASAVSEPDRPQILLESRRVSQARARLRAGDARSALAELERLSVEFPRGMLVQEREALAIEALLALGDRAAARRRAAAFLARFPGSPHGTPLERLLLESE